MTRLAATLLPLILLPLILLVGRVAAGDGSANTFIYGRPTRPDALAVEVDSRWIAGEGYRPVRVTIRPLNRPTFAQDRRVTLQLNRYHQWRDFPRELTERVIDLPAGASQITETIYVPQNRVQHQMELLCWEGRRTLRNVLRKPLASAPCTETLRESIPSVLIVDFDAPRLTNRNSIDRYRGSPTKGNAEGLDDQLPRAVEFIQALGNANPVNANAGWNQMASWVDIAEQVAHCDYLHPRDLPAGWIGLTGVDILFLSWEDLQRLHQGHPKIWQVIDAWLRGGGMLWVSGVGALESLTQSDDDENGRLVEVEQLLELPAASELSSALSPWHLPRRSEYGDRLDVMSRQQAFSKGQWITLADHKQPLGTPPPAAIPFAYRAHQLGTVVLWAKADPLTVNDVWHWQWVLKTLAPPTWMGSRRNGVSKLVKNEQFFHYLIPGVGLAPVNAFRFMMTLFVIVIGPLNYTLLRRWDRPNWMLYTVPACALCATLGILGYAAIADGTTTRTQTLNLVHVDQRKGHAVTWSRQSYYAGIAPARGAAFPTDVAATPVLYDPLDRMRFSALPRRLEWDSAQRFARGYLTSRNTAQFLVQRSRESDMRLGFDAAAATVENHLGGPILTLLVRSGTGAYYTGGVLAAGAVGPLTQVDAGARRAWFLQSFNLRDPRLPPGVQVDIPNTHDSSLWYYRRANQDLQAPMFNDSLMGRCLQAMTLSMELPAGSYLASTGRCDEVPLGVDPVKSVDSQYLIFGTFAPEGF